MEGEVGKADSPERGVKGGFIGAKTRGDEKGGEFVRVCAVQLLVCAYACLARRWQRERN